MKNKKNGCYKVKDVIYLSILVILLTASICVYINKNRREYMKKLEEDSILSLIESSYYKTVKVIKDTKLLDKNDNEIGTIYKDAIVNLDEVDINPYIEYFYIPSLGAYISYKAVEPYRALVEVNDRYKKYIPFNKNIITNENFTLYYNGNKLYTFNDSMEFPIIINNDAGKYYVEYDNKLVYILKEDIKKIINHTNTKEKNASYITTLCYHRVFNSKETCDNYQLCKKQDSFDKEMKWLKDNNYLTMTMQEMYWYVKGIGNFPKKSVMITLDDGKLLKSAVEVFEKYDIHAIVFLITGKFKNYEVTKSKTLELQSHTNDMHTNYVCPRETSYQQGGGILCYKEDKIVEDLKTSIKVINEHNEYNGGQEVIGLAYPFYDHNNRAHGLVKKAGLKLGFVGVANTDGRAYPGVDQYAVPRRTVWDSHSLNDFIAFVKN